MVVLVIFLCVMVLVGMCLAIGVGYEFGGEEARTELHRVQLEAAIAERRLHDLTRQAFVAMTEHAEQRQLED